MVDERSDVKFPLWRKKVDSSLFQHSMTVIPEWVKNDVFDIVEIFQESSKKHPSSKVIVEFIDDKKSSTHDGWVTTTKFREKWAAKRKPVMRFSFDARLTTKMQNKFSMSYARDVERKRKEYKVSEIEAEMPFYEFLDIEWDKDNRKFIFRPHYIQAPIYQKLFTQLQSKHVLERIENEIDGASKGKIAKGDWKGKSEIHNEIHNRERNLHAGRHG